MLSIRVEHHVVLGAKLLLGETLQDVLQLGDPLLHELPSLLQIDRLPLVHRHAPDLQRPEDPNKP